jgi:hypothetical protein
MGKRTKHTHKYIYQSLSPFNKGWRCALPHCTHFLPRNVEHMIDGSTSECWSCSEPFMINEDTIKDAIEHNFGMVRCADCRLTPEEREAALAFMKQFGVDDDTEQEDPVARAFRLTKERREKKHEPSEQDEVKSIEEETPKLHANDCPAWLGDACTCGVGDS